jgi:uncharacterized membrane protein
MNSSTPDVSSKERLLLLDIFKAFSMISIIVFHFNEFIFDFEFYPLRAETYFFNYVAYLSEYTAFSGQSIVAIFSFLFGLNGFSTSPKKFAKLLGLFAVGYVVINVSYYNTEALSTFYWDIYPFLLVSYISLTIIKENRLAILATALSGLAMLVFPYQPLSKTAGDSDLFREILYGMCNEQNQSSWPLFPWIGLVWVFFGLGRFINFNEALRLRLKRLNKAEMLVYGSVFLGTLPFFKYFGGTPYGKSLYCNVLQAPLLSTWAYLIFILLVIRMAFVAKVNHFCHALSVLRVCSNSTWAKYFGPTYIFHVLVLGILGNYSAILEHNPIYYDLALFGMFLGVEWFGLTLSYWEKPK